MNDIQHTFLKGLNRDISKNKFPKDAYYYLLNGRVTSDDNATLSDITNLKGNTEANIDNNGLDRTGFSIIGYAVLLNDIILFYAEDSATGVDSNITECIIDRLVYISNDAYNRFEVWRGTGLNFRIDKPIRAIAKYENSTTQKVYWTDYNNPVKQANMAETISEYEYFQFDMIGEFIHPSDSYLFTFDSYTSGSLKPGMVQYAFRLIKKNGAKTIFSKPSQLIPVGRNINIGDNLNNISGDAVYDPNTAYNTGKGIVVILDIYMGTIIDYTDLYDYVEVVSLWYSSKTAIPDINIISKLKLSNGTNFNIVDIGEATYGTLTYEEFLSQNFEFITKDLVVKDNRLFAGNIREVYFDIDIDATWTGKVGNAKWDARAYRFDSSRLCVLRNADLSGSAIYLDATDPGMDYTDVPETHDAANSYNRITETASDSYNLENNLPQKFQSNGTTIGGSGINISYTFTYSYSFLYRTDDVYPELSGGLTNEHHIAQPKTFQRDEVYRFGIVFFDNKGRSSFVKWIGDIRIPPLKDATGGNTWLSYNSAYQDYNSILVTPVFTVTNIPTINGQQLSYRIVYVPREEKDKSVVMTGMLQQTIVDGATNRASYIVDPANPGSLYNLVSPEINLRPEEFLNIDFVEVMGTLTEQYTSVKDLEAANSTFVNASGNYVPDQSRQDLIIRQYGGCSAYTGHSAADIDAFVKSVSPSSSEFLVNVGGISYRHYSVYGDTAAPHGTCYTFKLSGGSLVTPAGDTNYSYVYGRKRVFDSQYGGPSYQARQNNIYIDATGDTFCTIFEYGNYLIRKDAPRPKYYVEMYYIPCESSINCILRSGDTYSRIYSIDNKAVGYINESPYVDSSSGLFFTSLYNYNNAYSVQSTAVKYFAQPYLFEQIEEQFARIKYSDVKNENEDIDNWLNFRANNYYDTNENYGQINKLVEFKDNVFLFQDSAVGLVSINPRVTQQSTDGVSIILGTGEIIDSIKYLSTDVGCQDNSDVIQSLSALYWLDKNKKKIYTFSDSLQSISDIKGLSSYLKNNIREESQFLGTYDIANAEVLMTIRDGNPNTIFQATSLGGGNWFLSGIPSIIEVPFVIDRVYPIELGYYTYTGKTNSGYYFTYSHGVEFTDLQDVYLTNYITERDNFTIAYSEKMEAFEYFASFVPSLYVYHNKGFFTSNNDLDLWQHNIGDQYNTFYGVTYPTTLKIITNYASQLQSEYTNIKFFAEIWNEAGVLIPNETISNISLKDSTQISDDIILYPMHLPTDIDTTRYVLDTSSLRIGTDWYTGLLSNTEDLVVYQNELYRCLEDNQVGPPVIGDYWAKAELCNIRKTLNQWATQLPRFKYVENDSGDLEYIVSNRFRSDWLEITLELKDMLPGVNLYDRRLRLSDIKLINTPLMF